MRGVVLEGGLKSDEDSFVDPMGSISCSRRSDPSSPITPCSYLWPLILLLAAPLATCWSDKLSIPRIKLSYQEVQRLDGVHHFGSRFSTANFHPFLLDLERGRLYVGARDYLFALNLQNISRNPWKIFWPAASEWKEECQAAGKNSKTECGNFVRVLHPFNESHLYTCGTGAFHPVCAFVQVGKRAGSQEESFHLDFNHIENGKGKSPFDPTIPLASVLVEKELFTATAMDFMGRDQAVLRSSMGERPTLRTEAHNSHWLHDPKFVAAYWIPESDDPADDKLYFFFRETALEGEASDKATYTRLAQICRNDLGGTRTLVNKWSTFLKARLRCAVPGGENVDTHFDELQDVFLLKTRDPKNPLVYAAFSTSSPIFKGSAVCMYSMADIRRAFLGPFAHKEGPAFQWVNYQGKVPYPRPGTCPSSRFGGFHSTRDYPDTTLSFVRSHPIMAQSVHPMGGRPLLVRTREPAHITRLAVDRVEAKDGHYDVLFLGTDKGSLLKVVLVPKERWSDLEGVTLEEVQLFKEPTAILSVAISPKRQQLYISSLQGVVQVPLQRCHAYGPACASCCLSRDPYCAWDGRACSRYYPYSKRRHRRQDVRNGNPLTQCSDQFHNYDPDAGTSGEQRVHGVQNSSTLLECTPTSGQARIFWLFQKDAAAGKHQVEEGERVVLTDRGLLLRNLQPSDSGIYLCKAEELLGFVHTLTRVSLSVFDDQTIRKQVEWRLRGMAKNKDWYRHVLALLGRSDNDPSRRKSCRKLRWRMRTERDKHLQPGAHLQPGSHRKWKHLQQSLKSRNRRGHGQRRKPRSIEHGVHDGLKE
uniref:semaphorin-3A-like isoform X2 n=1 Tax=Myxine glutinosa TaxID=7769 RepID=UPI00358EA36B